jgi:hypothetical protein
MAARVFFQLEQDVNHSHQSSDEDKNEGNMSVLPHNAVTAWTWKIIILHFFYRSSVKPAVSI